MPPEAREGHPEDAVQCLPTEENLSEEGRDSATIIATRLDTVMEQLTNSIKDEETRTVVPEEERLLCVV